ncbi:AraC family transcriptional regulator [bacterium]|nr:MAG: AraC family transcriptional regulator [bacterium]
MHKKLVFLVKLAAMPTALVTENRTFFVDETARPAGRLTLAGTIKESAGVAGKPMRVFGQFALVLMVRGRGSYADARGTKREINPGDAILVLPELPHVYGAHPAKSRGGIWDELYLCFDGPVFDLWRHEGLLDDSQLVRSVNDWPAMFTRLCAFCEAPRPTNAHEHSKQLRDLLTILDDIFPARDKPNAEPLWLSRARAVLESNLGQPLGGQQAARAAQMNYESFRRSWKAHTGTTPQKYRDLKRIEAAKSLLRTATMTQGQIARSLGWRDEAHLSRRFRELTGMSVREWKTKNSTSK